MPPADISLPAVEIFIARWTACEGGAERANYQMFLSELCDVLGVQRPEPSGAEREQNDYVFERAVRPRGSDTTTVPKRIDLYKKNAFILEAKQSRLPGKKNALPGQLSMLADEPAALGRRSIAKGWDVMMKNARQQAESYVFLLDADHPAPPFTIVCDVGHCFELYADFTGTGRAYGYFPDRKGYRIYLEDLRDENVRTLLKRIWEEPHSLDPTKESARVTRDIAKRLAHVSKALEERGYHAEDVAHFLMRCIFTMFAEDVELLPEGAFTQLLKDCIDSPDAFAPLLEELWAKMDEPQHERRFYSLFKKHLRHFNGNLFKQTRAFPIGREEIGELWEASKARWTEVDPAIFGTLLEQALDKTERRKLGVHYTPRAYVQRLVDVTVYLKSKVFDSFPFPDPPDSLKAEIRTVAEKLDAFRKTRQAEHPKLTLTQMYNVLEKLKASATLNADEERIKDEGLILILKELHENLDRLVFQAYGWPEDLTDEEILERLVALNAERAKEEAAGHVRWLRPDYQIPRFAKSTAPKTGEMDLGANVVSIDQGKPAFPKDRYEQPLEVEAMLLHFGHPIDAAELARGFKSGGRKIEPRVEQVLTTLARYGRFAARMAA